MSAVIFFLWIHSDHCEAFEFDLYLILTHTFECNLQSNIVTPRPLSCLKIIMSVLLDNLSIIFWCF